MRREAGMTGALVALCLALYISNPDFLGQSNAINTLRQISMLGTFAIGIAFVIITGGIDLSVGSIIGLTGVMIAKLTAPDSDGSPGLSLTAAIVIALGIALLIGYVQGLLITRLKLQPFIVTLGGMLTIRGLSQTIAEGGTLSLMGSPLLDLGNGGFLLYDGRPIIPYPFLIFLGVIGIATYVLHFTVYGRYVYAIGGNRDAAEYSGINVRRIEASTYLISAGTAGIAGVCYAAYIGQMSQQVGIAYELYAIAAAVLGGCSLRGGEGTVLGIVIGSAVMRVIDNGINMFQAQYVDKDGVPRIWRLDPNWTFIIIGGVILVAVVLDQVVHLVQEKRRIRGAGETRAGGGGAAAGGGGGTAPPGGSAPPDTPTSDAA
jgi:ribose transport system permease protein